MLLLLSVACQAPQPFEPVEPPEGYAHHGIDVSVYQRRIDWEALAATGDVDVVYAKATEGRSHVDRRFERNWAGARGEGLSVGAYHYFSACRTGLEQAEHFIATVPKEEDALPPVLDVEPDGRCNRGARIVEALPEVEVWLDRVEEHYGVRPMLYSSDHVQGTMLAGLDAPRWIAAYSRAPRARADWEMWQHTDRGAVPGIDGPVDRNVLSAGALERLRR